VLTDIYLYLNKFSRHLLSINYAEMVVFIKKIWSVVWCNANLLFIVVYMFNNLAHEIFYVNKTWQKDAKSKLRNTAIYIGRNGSKLESQLKCFVWVEIPKENCSIFCLWMYLPCSQNAGREVPILLVNDWGITQLIHQLMHLYKSYTLKQ